jgi:hypothetical protein
MMPVARRLAILLWLFALPALAADAFVSGINDLPLMPGLRALPGEGTVFDAPAGRVVEAWADGAVAREAVLSFYAATLPQLGWSAAGPDLFRREGESLRLEFPAAGPRGDRATGTLLVRFYLSPG